MMPKVGPRVRIHFAPALSHVRTFHLEPARVDLLLPVDAGSYRGLPRAHGRARQPRSKILARRADRQPRTASHDDPRSKSAQDARPKGLAARCRLRPAGLQTNRRRTEG
jgi:hypothetical protein